MHGTPSYNAAKPLTLHEDPAAVLPALGHVMEPPIAQKASAVNVTSMDTYSVHAGVQASLHRRAAMEQALCTAQGRCDAVGHVLPPVRARVHQSPSHDVPWVRPPIQGRSGHLQAPCGFTQLQVPVACSRGACLLLRLHVGDSNEL